MSKNCVYRASQTASQCTVGLLYYGLHWHLVGNVVHCIKCLSDYNCIHLIMEIHKFHNNWHIVNPLFSGFMCRIIFHLLLELSVERWRHYQRSTTLQAWPWQTLFKKTCNTYVNTNKYQKRHTNHKTWPCTVNRSKKTLHLTVTTYNLRHYSSLLVTVSVVLIKFWHCDHFNMKVFWNNLMCVTGTLRSVLDLMKY